MIDVLLKPILPRLTKWLKKQDIDGEVVKLIDDQQKNYDDDFVFIATRHGLIGATINDENIMTQQQIEFKGEFKKILTFSELISFLIENKL